MAEVEEKVDKRLFKKLLVTQVVLKKLGHFVFFTPNGSEIQVGRCKHCNYLTLVERKKNGKKWKAWGTALTTECPKPFQGLKGPKP